MSYEWCVDDGTQMTLSFSPPYPLHKGDSLLFVILKGAKRSEESECISTSPLERGRGV